MFLLDRIFAESRFFARGPMTYFDHTTEAQVDHVMAAVVLVRRDVLSKEGLFDERLSVYYNDLDLSYRMARTGWKSAFLPRAKAVHHGGHTARPMISELTFFREQYENIFYYYRKHFGKRALRLYRVMLLAGFIPRVVLWSLVSFFSKSTETLERRSFAVRTVQIALSSTPEGKKE